MKNKNKNLKEHGEKTIINLYHNACGFKDTCFKLIKTIYTPNTIIEEANLFPIMEINGMFSVELFCKYIYVMDNIIANDRIISRTAYCEVHSFYALYSLFKGSTKKEIVNELENIGCSKETFTSFKLKTKASKNGDPITKLRYCDFKHKKNYKFDTNTMIKIVYVLHNCAKKRLNKQYFKEKCYRNNREIIGVCNNQIHSFEILDKFSLDIINNNFEIFP